DVLDNRTSDPREVWLEVVFAVAHAERLGCSDARKLTLEWSRRGASWSTEADFETAWTSYKPKPGGITVGSLLARAAKAGPDLSPWRDPALTGLNLTAEPTLGSTGIGSTSAPPTSQRALCIAALPSIPPKRQWLHGVDLVRGAVSLLV